VGEPPNERSLRTRRRRSARAAVTDSNAASGDAAPPPVTARGPHRIEALIFDVDGTLADTEEAHRQAFNDAFRAHDLEFRWSRELYGELLQVTGGKERLAAFFERTPLAVSERERLAGLIPRLHATKTSCYRARLERGAAPLRSGVRRLMDEARAAGVSLAIASTTSPENVAALLAGVLGQAALARFEVIATGDVVPRKKPAPDIYLLALRRLGVAARCAIAFEDSAVGVAAAKAAGVFTVATPSDWTGSQDFAAADLVLPSLADRDAPLGPVDAGRIGAPYLGLEQLASLQGAFPPRVAHSA
jgi:HAD superfamily hydrolase (TIGR01509 family)